MSKYIPGHIIDEARDLRRQGHSLASLASRLGIDPEALGVLLGEPTTKPAESAGFDLWRTCELDAVL
jgi:lambda repressor-like predicted transcriptional regulator